MYYNLLPRARDFFSTSGSVIFQEVQMPQISVDLDLPCEECLDPVWEITVSVNGSYMCDSE